MDTDGDARDAAQGEPSAPAPGDGTGEPPTRPGRHDAPPPTDAGLVGSSAPSARPLRRIPALDGVRGLAVVAVLAFHDGRLRGGYLGVDLFFVLSGYLITSLMVLEWVDTGTIRLRAFWARRVRRLLPALLCLLLLVGLAAQWGVRPIARGHLRESGLATLAQVANWHTIWSADGYWEQALVPSWLQHTWSLAIEEQVYLVWPLAVLGLLGAAWAAHARVGRPATRTGALRWLAVASLVGAALSAGSMIVRSFAGASIERLYLGTDTRVAAVLLGAAAACWQRAAELDRRHGAPSPGAGRALAGAGYLGAAALAVAWFRLDGTDPRLYRGGLLACGIAATAVLVALAGPRVTLLGRVLAWRPLVALGAISYGLYLYHWPIYQILYPDRLGLRGWSLTGARVGASLAAAVLSYHLLERPIRERRWNLRLGWAAPAGLAVTALVLVVGTRGAIDPNPPEPVPVVAAATPPRPPRADDVNVLVVGDSVAISLAQWGWTPDPISPRLVVTNGATVGCGLLEPVEQVEGLYVHDCIPTWPAALEETEADVAVMLFGAWAGTRPKKVTDGVAGFPCTEPHDTFFYDRIDEVVDVLSSRGSRVVLVTSPGPPNSLFKGHDPPLADARQECWNDVVRAVGRDRAEAEVIDLAAWMCPTSTTCELEVDGAELRPDGLHFREAGSRVVARWMTPQILAAADADR